MKDIIEQILATKPKRMGFGTQRVTPDCAAGRCGHKSIPLRTVLFAKANVIQAMDEYAERILQWLHDNGQDFSANADFDAKEYLEEIKTELNEKKK